VKPSEAVELVRRLKANWENDKISQDRVALWTEFLMDLDAEAGRIAVNEAIATLKFPPKVAEIREFAAKKASGVPIATSAWGEVMKGFGKFGRYRDPKWSHPAITHVVDAMGWQSMCDSENIEATRAHFLRLYQETSERVVREVNVRPMLESGKRSGEPVALAEALRALPGGKRE
jgi:hypothetical protein